MNELYSGMESKIFSLLIISFLYIFQKKFQSISKEKSLLYLFSFIQIFFSGAAAFIKNEAAERIFFIICGIACFLAVYYFGKCIFKKSYIKKVFCILVGVMFGIADYYSSLSGINAVNFLMVFAILALFVSEQYNKTRVDNLTKLYNRYGMDVELKEQLRQYRKDNNDSFYLIACDLDNFKHINDTWGHPEGDRALRLVADVLGKVGKMFSAGVYRIGGDEFVIITDKSYSGLDTDIINAVKAELDKLDFRDDFDIKMSIGAALYDGITPIDELLGNADKKLYEAKKDAKTKEKACV